MQATSEKHDGAARPRGVEITAPDNYLMSLFGFEAHKYSFHNFQLRFLNGMWEITLQSLICLFCVFEDH